MVGVWRVEKNKVARIEPTSVRLERELEEWVERNPSLLEAGLEVVGRQIRVEAGIIDLLALDPTGRWVVIEIKKGAVHRETVAQALDYASCIARMRFQELWGTVNDYLKSTAGEDRKLVEALKDRIQSERADEKDREVAVYVVGTGQDPSLERVLDFLDKSQRAVNAVLFNIFDLESGHRILVRELTSNELAAEGAPPSIRPSVRDVVEVAERNGLGEAFKSFLAIAERHGFHPRPFRHSIMFAPANNRARCLFVAWVKPPAEGVVKLFVAPEAFQEFYGLPKGLVLKELGDEGYRKLTVSQVLDFVGSLDRLMSSVEQ